MTIARVPSARRGHSSRGRSQYSSTPLPSGSRRYSASLTPWSDAPSSGISASRTRRSASASAVAGRVEDGDVEQARRAAARRRAAAALPGVQPDVVVVAARRDERRLVAVPLRAARSRGRRSRTECALQVGDLQVDVADVDARVDPHGGSVGAPPRDRDVRVGARLARPAVGARARCVRAGQARPREVTRDRTTSVRRRGRRGTPRAPTRRGGRAPARRARPRTAPWPRRRGRARAGGGADA